MVYLKVDLGIRSEEPGSEIEKEEETSNIETAALSSRGSVLLELPKKHTEYLSVMSI